jgi:hypothetical protein
MSDNTQTVDDRERLRKEAEEQAKQADAIAWGAFEGEAVIIDLKGSDSVEAGDPEFHGRFKESVQHKQPQYDGGACEGPRGGGE